MNLIEETYGTRHPDFSAIREQFERITNNVYDEDVGSDVRLLLAGVDAARNTYEDWEELEEYEREQAIDAIKRVRDLTWSILREYDVTVD